MQQNTRNTEPASFYILSSFYTTRECTHSIRSIHGMPAISWSWNQNRGRSGIGRGSLKRTVDKSADIDDRAWCNGSWGSSSNHASSLWEREIFARAVQEERRNEDVTLRGCSFFLSLSLCLFLLIPRDEREIPSVIARSLFRVSLDFVIRVENNKRNDVERVFLIIFSIRLLFVYSIYF